MNAQILTTLVAKRHVDIHIQEQGMLPFSVSVHARDDGNGVYLHFFGIGEKVISIDSLGANSVNILFTKPEI